MNLERKFLLMGIAGTGKSTLGCLLASKLNSEFVEADDFHSRKNKVKMSEGIPLKSFEREIWLNRLFYYLESGASDKVVVACSALTEKSQKRFTELGFKCIFLNGSQKLIRMRLNSRKDHFFNESLLKDQIKNLSPPSADLELDITKSAEDLCREVLIFFN